MHQVQIHGVRIARKAEAKVIQLRRDVQADELALWQNDSNLLYELKKLEERVLALEKWTGLYYARKLRAWMRRK